MCPDHHFTLFIELPAGLNRWVDFSVVHDRISLSKEYESTGGAFAERLAHDEADPWNLFG
ncbi:hypothetical protein TAMA11512_15320 [Selenomonas sp. TAMA-11512]|nr:hypothetical protein TAMA11512_15320 [Selenomonas sp. TAMA-11512]